MRTIHKAASVTFSSVVVFGKMPFSVVSANSLASIHSCHAKTRKIMKNARTDATALTGMDGVDSVFANLGTVADFQHTDAAGKVAVVTRGFISMIEKMKNAIAAGAIALVILLACTRCESKESDEQTEEQHEENASAQSAVTMINSKSVLSQTAVSDNTLESKRKEALFQRLKRTMIPARKRLLRIANRRIRLSGRSHDSPRSKREKSSLLCAA